MLQISYKESQFFDPVEKLTLNKNWWGENYPLHMSTLGMEMEISCLSAAF